MFPNIFFEHAQINYQLSSPNVFFCKMLNIDAEVQYDTAILCFLEHTI